MISKIIGFSLATIFLVNVSVAQEMGTRAATADLVKSGELPSSNAAVDTVDIAKKLSNPIANMIS